MRRLHAQRHAQAFELRHRSRRGRPSACARESRSRASRCDPGSAASADGRRAVGLQGSRPLPTALPSCVRYCLGCAPGLSWLGFALGGGRPRGAFSLLPAPVGSARPLWRLRAERVQRPFAPGRVQRARGTPTRRGRPSRGVFCRHRGTGNGLTSTLGTRPSVRKLVAPGAVRSYPAAVLPTNTIRADAHEAHHSREPDV